MLLLLFLLYHFCSVLAWGLFWLMSCNAFAYISVFVFSSCKEKTPTRVLNGKNIEKSGKCGGDTENRDKNIERVL